jgi:hypothetical protein
MKTIVPEELSVTSCISRRYSMAQNEKKNRTNVLEKKTTTRRKDRHAILTIPNDIARFLEWCGLG